MADQFSSEKRPCYISSPFHFTLGEPGSGGNRSRRQEPVAARFVFLMKVFCVCDHECHYVHLQKRESNDIRAQLQKSASFCLIVSRECWHIPWLSGSRSKICSAEGAADISDKHLPGTWPLVGHLAPSCIGLLHVWNRSNSSRSTTTLLFPVYTESSLG